MVTIPIVRSPRSRAMRATTGDAPVPVPPPMPAVINTILVLSLKISAIFSALSSAAALATSGLLPAPRPLPICTLVGTGDCIRALRSVLSTTNDTCLMSCRNIWLTALLPPPPTPSTFMITSSSSPVANPASYALGMSSIVMSVIISG